MPRRLILVDFPWSRDKDPRLPLGHASLLAALREVGDVDVRSVVIPVNVSLPSPLEVALQLLSLTDGWAANTVDLAFGVYVWAEELVQAVLPLVRAGGFRGRMILGGPQISYAGPGVDALYPQADVFVRGYGELALSSLATRPGRTPIPGVHYRGLPDGAAQTEVDLASLPSALLSGVLPLDGLTFLRWETQRGCPFRCAFCQHREPGRRLRRRTLGQNRIAREIELICRSAVREVAVLDPIFNSGDESVRILEEFHRRGFTGRLSLQCRAESIDERFLDAAARLDVTLEFGLQTIHEREGRAIDRRNDLARVDHTLCHVRERGIRHEVTLIFGLPEQTLASFKESVAWCLARRVPVLKAFPLMLLRGTALDARRAEWGLVEDVSAMPCVVASDTFDEEDWRRMAQLSEALRRTEGAHPVDFDALSIGAVDVSRVGRWRPLSLLEAGT